MCAKARKLFCRLWHINFVNLANAACIAVRGNPQNFGETRLYSPNTVMRISPKSVEVKD